MPVPDPLAPRRRAGDTGPPEARLLALEADLARLRQELHLSLARESRQAVDLREANERLVVAALQAETLADSAFTQLEQLNHAAGHDPLTGAASRAIMLDRIAAAAALARRHQSRFALIFVDLDGFKEINDTLGHEVGDAALVLVARRLEAAVRASDTVGRHGGDEFLVLLSEIAQPADAGLLATKILEGLALPVDASPVTLGASLGIAVFPEDGEDAASLIRSADEAMYAAKRRGGRDFEFSRPAALADAAAVPTRAGRRPARGDDSPHADELREANEHLVVAALAAQESATAAQKAAQACSEQRRRSDRHLSMLVHELRGPLSPLRSCMDILRDPSIDGPAMRVVNVMLDRQISQLARIVQDLADGPSDDVPGFRLERRPVDLGTLLAEVFESFKASMASSGHGFEMRAPRAVPALVVDADPVRLVQVLRNLIDNAAKYTPASGRIVLAVGFSARTASVSVTDSGMGIAHEALPHVFDLYVRESRARDVDGQGRGIGLAVARSIVQAHGGTLAARSAGPGRGSTFELLLPRAPC